MSRRVQITREILGDLVRLNRKQQSDLRIEEDKLLLLIDWYEPDLGKIIKNGQIVEFKLPEKQKKV